MRFFVISDSHDTVTGFRLAGVDGAHVHERQDVNAAVARVIADPDIGVLLITENLSRKTPHLLYELRLKLMHTLVVEIPDRHGTGRSTDSITRYIREAIGITV